MSEHRHRPLPTLGATVMATALLAGCVNPFAEPEVPTTAFAAFGQPDSGWAAPGDDYDGAAAKPFPACFLINVNDLDNRGQVLANGFIDEETQLDIYFEEFRGRNETRGGGIGENPPDRGQAPDGRYVLPVVETHMAGWGNATYEVNAQVAEDEFTGELNLTATFFLTHDGFRDDATNAIRTGDGSQRFDPARPSDVRARRGDWEAHLYLQSHQSTGERLRLINFGSQDETGAGLIVANSNYNEEFSYFVPWPGAKASFEVTLRTPGPTLQQNRLTFNFLDPDGRSYGNVTVGGAASPQDVKTLAFDSTHLGEYRVAVKGSAYASNFTVAGRVTSPEAYRLHLWWEELNLNPHDVFRGYDNCAAALNRDASSPIGMNEALRKPPRISLEIIVVGIAATLLMGLFVVKLVLDAVKIEEFKRTYRKR